MTPTGAEIQQAFGFAGAVVARRRLGSAPLIFFVDVEVEEIRRRAEVGIGAIVDRRVVNALWELPEEVGYPVVSLPEWVIRRLTGVDAVEIGRLVCRHVRPPVRIRGAAAVGRSLSRLLEALGPLSSVCATAAVLTGTPPRSTDSALLDAQLFGVAVGVAAPPGIRVLHAAQPVRPDMGAYQWHLGELVYAAIGDVS